MRRLYTLFAVALLLLPLLLPHGLSLLGVSEGTKSQDNSVKTTMPALSLAATDFKAFATQLRQAYAEEFPFRSWMIRTANRLRIAVFGQSPSKDVMLGREGWLFYKSEMEQEDWLGVGLLSDEELAMAKAELSRKRDWLARRGIALLVVVVPNKSTVYGEFMPSGMAKLSPVTRLDQFAQAMREADVPFLDLRPAMQEAKTTRRAYWKTDSHWNGWGAFSGSQAIVERLRQTFPAMPPLRPEDYAVREVAKPGGDLAGMLLLEGEIPERDIELTPLAPNTSQPAAPKGYANPATLSGRDMIIRETGDAALPKAVIFRDSFSTAAWPFLAERFSRSVFLWDHQFNPRIVEREKPDIVIYEAVERYQNQLFYNQNWKE